jgi:hypothetical protein
MSTSHHGDPEAERRLLDQFLNRAEPAFPRGKIHKEDEGQLAFALAVDPRNQIVIIHFGKPVDWIGLAKADALRLATMLLEKAKEL